MIGALILSVGIGYFYVLPFASLLQGGGYRLSAYFRRGGKYIALSAGYFLVLLGPLVAAALFLPVVAKYILFFLAVIVLGATLFFTAHAMRVHVTFTNRLVRLLLLSTGLSLCLFLPLHFLSLELLWAATPALSPLILCLSTLILAPFERRNNVKYIRRASEKLGKVPLVIGITGSYGKTGVKGCLDKLISLKYRCLATPANYNTPLGIAKSVEDMSDDTEVFLAEMGARRRGDIRELVEMTRPSLGIITGIAPQHLETFGSIEEVMAEKEELAKGVKEGCVYYNVASEGARKLYDRREERKVSVGYREADALISAPKITLEGTAFSLIYRGKTLSIFLPLLGRAAAEDFALAAVVALDLGVEEEDIIEGAKRLSPVPHRMEVIRQGGLTILDDSYNINPVGAFAALSTLSALPAVRRAVYTSGMVELGKESDALNEAFGRKIGEVCDLAIVQRSSYGDAVVRGIESAGGGTRVLRVADTAEATTLFPREVGAGDVLLITSDLPRDYLL